MMETFLIDESVDYVCIGPLKSVALASEQLERGDPAPECWSKPPSAQCGGTVLVHDVDMRVPALHGEWRAGRLNNLEVENVCGGMVWHESVGGCEGAAKLLHLMQEAGGCVICNDETDEVVSQGIRFIGRYSWNDSRENKEIERLSSECYDTIARGPTCFFMPKDVVADGLLPDVKNRIAGQKKKVKEEVDKLMAAGNGNEEELMDDVAYSLLDAEPDEDPYGLRPFLLPSMSTYSGKNQEKRGAGFSFQDQEYLFGRLWMTPEGKCKAFCFYTYHSPETFDSMTVEDCPVNPNA